MKNCALFFVIIAICLSGNISLAQNSILAGKIVDENNKPIPGAIIKICNGDGLVQELKADADGLYTSKLLKTGAYKLAVDAGKKHRELDNFSLDPKAGSERYYIIKVAGGKLSAEMVPEDPSIKVKLAKIREDKYNEVPGDHVFFMKVDSVTGKPTSVQGPAGGVPKAY